MEFREMFFYLGLILSLAVFVEGTVEYFQDSVPERLKKYNKHIAALLGIVVCILYGADLFKLFGYEAMYPYVGSVITGIICGRGSNYVNDFVSWMQAFTNKANSATTANRAVALQAFSELKSEIPIKIESVDESDPTKLFETLSAKNYDIK